jgi:hypothetical protein
MAQTIKSYFEKNFILAYLCFDEAPNEGHAVYSNPIQLYNSVNNPIRILCLNSDQKKVNVSNITVQAGLFESGTQNQLILQTATPVDAANGIIQINLLSSDLSGLDFGTYEMALVASDLGGNSYPVYINDFYGSRLQTQLSPGPVLGYPDPINLSWVDTVGVGVVTSQINLTNRPINSSLATAYIVFNQYTGNITSQGTLVTTPQNTDWSNITSTYYSNVSGGVFQNTPGSYTWLRFIADGLDPSKTGNLNQSNISNVIVGGNIRI